MASLTQWTWVSACVKDRGPGVLPSMGSERVKHNWVSEQDGWDEVLCPWCVSRVVAQRSRSEIDLATMVSCRAERGTHLHVRSACQITCKVKPHVKWFQTRSSEPYRGLPRGQWGKEEWGFLPCSISARAAPFLSLGIPPKLSFAERIPWHHLIPVCLLH